MSGNMDEDLDPELLKELEARTPELRRLSERHFNEPHISYPAYTRARKLSLGAEVIRKTRIYLDQRYWIYCRDAYLGKPQRPIHVPIWNRLCELVDSGKVVCPATYPVLIETFKQYDQTKRTATAAVIDRLSGGAALQPFHEMLGNELYHFIRKTTRGTDAVYPLAQIGWTFPAWIVGERVPTFPALNEATNNALQKCAFDTLAMMPFSALVRARDNRSLPARWDTDDHYRKLNQGARDHQHEVTSYQTVFMSEVAGVLDEYTDVIPALFAQIFEQDTGKASGPLDAQQTAEAARLGRNLIYNLYLHKKLSIDLPFVHVIAGVNAAIRHRRQPYKSGDHWDHLHAHQALGYCSAFFTEKNLGNLLCTSPLRYDAAYGCHVLWKDDAVLTFLQSAG